MDEHGTTWWRWDGTVRQSRELEPYLRSVCDRAVQPNVIRRHYAAEDNVTVFVRNATSPGEGWMPADPVDTEPYPLHRVDGFVTQS